MPHKKKFNLKAAALANGWRSGLEESVGAQLDSAGVPFDYEKYVINYTPPAKERSYTPDFVLGNGIIVETKGRFTTEDRQKMKVVRTQHPDLDIRFVFSNPLTRISKASKTTYAKWCEDNGFPYVATKRIPPEWLKEPVSEPRLSFINQLKQKP
jgi:hypothetical protein